MTPRRRKQLPPPRRVVIDRPPPVCEHGNPRCGAVPVRFYPCGYRCDDHQPANTFRRTIP